MTQITTREKEILRHFCHGLTSKEVAKECHISIHTVDSHRKRLYRKLDVRTGVQLGAKAISQNLIDLD